MTPRLEACYFGDGDRWPRMARVLEATARQHCPSWDVHVVELEKPTIEAHGAPYAANTHKLAYWCDVVQRAPDGTELLLIDADTAILRPLDDVWRQPFDVAYTVRLSGSKYPFNAGVMFVRVNQRTRPFFAHWNDVNHKFAEDSALHQLWKRRYGGINQAALGCVFDHQPTDHPGLQLAELPVLEWNCEDDSWPHFDEALTRILHVKSMLRHAVFDRVGPPSLRLLANRWREIERAVLERDKVTA